MPSTSTSVASLIQARPRDSEISSSFILVHSKNAQSAIDFPIEGEKSRGEGRVDARVHARVYMRACVHVCTRPRARMCADVSLDTEWQKSAENRRCVAGVRARSPSAAASVSNQTRNSAGRGWKTECEPEMSFPWNPFGSKQGTSSFPLAPAFPFTSSATPGLPPPRLPLRARADS